MLSSAHAPRLVRIPSYHLRPINSLDTVQSSPLPTTNTPSSQVLTIRKSFLTKQTTVVDLAKSFLEDLDRIRLTEPQLKQLPFVGKYLTSHPSLLGMIYMESKPLKGLIVGVIRETFGDGVDPEVISSVRGAVTHLEELGYFVTDVAFSQVSLPSFSLGLPAYYVLASSESSSNLSCYDGIRYGN